MKRLAELQASLSVATRLAAEARAHGMPTLAADWRARAREVKREIAKEEQRMAGTMRSVARWAGARQRIRHVVAGGVQ